MASFLDPKIAGPAAVAEIDELLRTLPNFSTEALGILSEVQKGISRPAWLGRFAAVMKAINPIEYGLAADSILSGLSIGVTSSMRAQYVSRIPVLLHEARYQAQLSSPEGTGVAVSAGQPFQYFDEVRRIIETANEDVLFVDAYMGADFVARYLPHLKSHVRVRLLSREYMPKLISGSRCS